VFLQLDWCRQDVRGIAILTHEKFEFLKNKKSFFFSDFETPYFFSILFSKEGLSFFSILFDFETPQSGLY